MLIAVLVVFAHSAAGAGSVGRYIRLHAEQLVERFIGSSEYQVIVSTVPLDPKGEPPAEDLPYLPPLGGDRNAVHPDDPLSLKSQVQSVEIRIFLPERVDETARRDLRQLLQATFGLNMQAGRDRVEFSTINFGIDADKESATPPAENPRVSTLESDLRRIETERDDLKRDLALARQDVGTLEREARQSKDASSAAPGPTTLRDYLLSSLGPALVALAALVGLIGAALLLSRGVRTVGSSLQQAAGQIAQGLNQGSRDDERQLGKNPADGSDPSPGIDSGSSLHSMRIAETYERILRLQDELVVLIGEAGSFGETLVLEYVSGNLVSEVQHERAICAMEILGKEKSNAYYSKLGSVQQAKVTRFLTTRHYSKAKAHLLLEVGEELRTLLLSGDILKTRAVLDPQVKELLIQLDEANLADVLQRLDETTLARFLVYLTPAQVAALLAQTKEDEDGTEKLGQSMLRMPAAAAQIDLDQQLTPVLREVLETQENVLEKPYLAYYTQIIEHTSDDLSESMMRILAEGSEIIGDHLRRHAVTFATLFRLRTEVQEEIIDRLSIAELAVAISLIDNPAQRQAIESRMDGRRLEIVRDDALRIEGWSSRERSKALQNLKQKIVSEIKKIQGGSDLSELLGPTEDGGAA